MKIQKIQALCKAAKRIVIFNDENHGMQWISDGYCIFPLFNLPKLNEKNVYALFDIPEDKQGKIFFEEREELPRSICFSDYDKTEVAVKPEAFGISAYGRRLNVIRGSEGATLYDARYFSVFEDDATFFERPRADGAPYIVVKEGMFLAGVLLPYEANNELREWLVNVGESMRVKDTE